MGKLTDQPFIESCCDGGSTSGTESCQPCGCDMGAKPPHFCEQHKVKVAPESTSIFQPGMIRKFETGATRDIDTNKLDFEGFESPLVIHRFAEFMHSNRLQKDGTLRDSDNWQKGIPKDAYMKSMWRHLMDVWLHHRGLEYLTKEPLEVALCALRFNVSGYLLEELKEKNK